MSVDQWARWRHAVAGNRIETERGNPASGFYKQTTGEPEPRHIEAICIFRDEAGKLECMRNVYGDGSKMDADAIDDLFGKVCLYPISEEQYRAVTERGEAWPAEYGTGGRLSMKDQQAGVAWSPAYGRKKLGLDLQPAVPADPVAASAAPAGDPAPAGHTLAGEQTPDKVMFAEVSALATSVKRWLTDIGGTPRNKAEADQLGDFAVRFKTLAKKAEDQRKQAKEPHLQAGRDVDAAWKKPVELAETSRKRALEIAQAWMDAENVRLHAEQQAAADQARDSGVTLAPTEAPECVTSVGNMRSVSTRVRTVWTVNDPRLFLRHLIESNEDLPTEIIEALDKVANRRATAAPGVVSEARRSAA